MRTRMRITTWLTYEGLEFYQEVVPEPYQAPAEGDMRHQVLRSLRQRFAQDCNSVRKITDKMPAIALLRLTYLES